MPILKRIIEPQYVSRGVVGPNVSNELECVSNITLANVIFQLSSLSKYSEDLFGELHYETSRIFYRICQLNKRTEQLSRNVMHLNPIVEEVSLQDINTRKPFKSSVIKEHQIISIHSRPQAIAEVYAYVEPAPPLSILNVYRDDGKDSLKFYTDPGYFFELWSQEITKNAENQVKKHRHRKGRSVRPSKEPPPIRTLKANHSEHHSPVSGQPRSPRVSAIMPEDPTTPGGMKQPMSPGRQAVANQRLRKDSSSPLKSDRDSVGVCRTPPIGSASPRCTSKNEFVYPGGAVESRRDRSHVTSHLVESGPAQEKTAEVGQIVHHGARTILPASLPLSGGVQIAIQISGRNSNVGAELHQRFAALPPAVQHGTVSFQDCETSDHLKFTVARPISETDSPSSGNRDSLDLPPPPTPPTEMPLSYGPMPSPPPCPSLEVEYYPQYASLPNSPVLPPPLYETDCSYAGSFVPGFVGIPPGQHRISAGEMLPGGDEAVQGGFPEEVVYASSEVVGCNEVDAENEHKSDLLTAIKKGIRLRKVEEQRLKSAQKQKSISRGHLDVQSIMEAAFEMRRKALEESDSDDDDDGDELDNHWTDDD